MAMAVLVSRRHHLRVVVWMRSDGPLRGRHCYNAQTTIHAFDNQLFTLPRPTDSFTNNVY
jgi:hypothetical protein